MPAVDYGTAADINKFMTGQANAPFISNLPNYQQMVAQSSGNTLSNLKGEIPPDVLALIQQQAAERGVATGSPGSPNSNAAYLRALGLTSLQLQNQGEQNLTGAINRTPVPQLFNPASLYVPQTLAAQELNAAKAGQASTRSGGAPQISAYTPTHAPQISSYTPPAAPYGGLTQGQAFGTMNVGGQFLNDQQIQKIANGHLDDNWRIMDDPLSPMIGNDIPEGTWYNPDDETFNAPGYGNEDFSSYFE